MCYTSSLPLVMTLAADPSTFSPIAFQQAMSRALDLDVRLTAQEDVTIDGYVNVQAFVIACSLNTGRCLSEAELLEVGVARLSNLWEITLTPSQELNDPAVSATVTSDLGYSYNTVGAQARPTGTNGTCACLG